MELRHEARERQAHNGHGWYTLEEHYAISPRGEARFKPEELNGDSFYLGAGRSLHWAKYDRAGNRLSHGDDRSTTPTAQELAVWDEIAREIAARQGAPAGYIRFGELPQCGRSKNHATGEYEVGVSCYRADYNPITGVYMFAAQSSLPCAALEGAFGLYAVVLLIEGREVGVGSDGEPLLAAAKVIGELTYDAARKGYVLAEKEGE